MENQNELFAHDDLCVGIDLGTTNSVLAAINERNGKINCIVVDIQRATDAYSYGSADLKLATRKDKPLPSFVYYRQEKNFRPIVGDFAKRQYPLRPHLVAKSIKSQMGNPLAEGLSPDIPDKTPSQISARILQHLLTEGAKTLRPKNKKITDAVITVPANFNSAMCKATRDAAQIAGIQVTDEDGTERPILLPEPNAVIYDLINQIQNGDIPKTIIDLSSKKYVLVFDLGGGTLDITMHEIQEREDYPDVLKVNEIATNRYTRLGGDNFDDALAQAMYQRFIRQYAKSSNTVAELQKPENKNIIMATLSLYAENLKFEINETKDLDYDSNWGDDADDNTFNVGGNIGGVGYSYDDTFTREEIETIYQPLMGKNLKFSDYKRLNQITDNYNIIYPILDVLQKASLKLGIADVPVDAVILNGGMSKFYMVKDRLREFFGLEPIVALDPDLSVARGAAVYHYYLHKYQQIQDDMRLVGEASEVESFSEMPAETAPVIPQPVRRPIPTGIEWGKKILNESLYLSVRKGAEPPEIISAGTELPYTSQIMTGYKMDPKINQINIPIMTKEMNGTYKTIASGKLNFKRAYPEGAYVMFNIEMDTNKILTMNAWTTQDISGNKTMEQVKATIIISNDGPDSGKRNKNKLEVPAGSKLNAISEIYTLMQLCAKLYAGSGKKGQKKNKSNELRQKIKSSVSAICSASNKEDFAEPILDRLEKIADDYTRMRLFTISRKIGETWSAENKKRLAKLCMQQLDLDLKGMSYGSGSKSANPEALQTLSICGSPKQLVELRKIIDKPQYKQAFMYTYGRTQTNIDWLYQELERNIKLAKEGSKRNIQFSSYFLGLACRYNESNPYPVNTYDREMFAAKICSIIQNIMLTKSELISCILALGFICDRRHADTDNYCVSEEFVEQVFHVLDNIDYYQTPFMLMECEKPISVITKMLKGETLATDDEKYLLTRIDMVDDFS